MTSRPDNKSNLASEQLGLAHVMGSDPKIIQPSLQEKKKVLEICKLPNLYIRSFDLVRLNVENFSQIRSIEDFSLIEVKVTRKKLPNFPKGFFFGMTENEESLLRDLRESFLLCLISVHDEGSEFVLLSYVELQSMIRTKRVQYQINL